ncbi:hypothetical protein TNCV_3385461 [Trichonephila clavipes]|uniref:Uncharacterized protein n=1 Tax=Trichonephila clavipes TaxID=2585209 RepID=A0A8X6SUK4_TRICX|nr:hypothetical protein TNCV_3385461 [Trichonephila clavipes]
MTIGTLGHWPACFVRHTEAGLLQSLQSYQKSSAVVLEDYEGCGDTPYTPHKKKPYTNRSGDLGGQLVPRPD